jgi:hypothetical protein
LPKLNEQIAVHLSEEQILDLIKDEVEHLNRDLECGVGSNYRPIKPKEILHRAEQIERLAELLPQ